MALECALLASQDIVQTMTLYDIKWFSCERFCIARWLWASFSIMIGPAVVWRGVGADRGRVNEFESTPHHIQMTGSPLEWVDKEAMLAHEITKRV